MLNKNKHNLFHFSCHVLCHVLLLVHFIKWLFLKNVTHFILLLSLMEKRWKCFFSFREHCIIKLCKHGFFEMYVTWLPQLRVLKHRGGIPDIGDYNSCIKSLSLVALCAPWKDHGGPEEPPAVSLKYWAAQKCARWNPACLPCCWMALLFLSPSQFDSFQVHSASV